MDMENHNEELQENPTVQKRLFGRGIYGSKDVPIRILDGLIGVLIVLIVAMIGYFAINGGFHVTFDTQGGSEVAAQKVRHSQYAAEPEAPAKPGYVFDGWYLEGGVPWDFAKDTVQNDLTLIASWKPAEITVKFDLDGGTWNGSDTLEPVSVIYGETYGELPVPSKEGYEFDGWYYSGARIESDTKVTTNGEHVLTAQWRG